MELSHIAQDFFARILEMLTDKELQPAVVNKMMHETLVLTCHEGTRGTNQSYGNLFSQVDYLCRKHHIKPAETVEIQRMRRHSNRVQPLTEEERKYDARALALLVSAVMSEDIPSALRRLLPTNPQSIGQQTLPPDIGCLRCIVREWDEHDVRVAVDHDDGPEILTVRYGEVRNGIDLRYLKTVFREGMQLNVLDASMEDGVLMPRLIIVEPDFLVDISTIAACFKEYGHHPLSLLMAQMDKRANSQAILLGRFAGAALDDIINHSNVTLSSVLQNDFKKNALEYAVCNDFQEESFKISAEEQIANLKETVIELLKEYDREAMILEPSFVCEKLGIQGRVDLMTTDFRLLVEQKSGRNMHLEYGGQNRQGSKQLETHYVQLLLYYGILRYNFHVSRSKTDIRLLYSRYPASQGLMVVSYYQRLFDEAICLRNQWVATQFWIAKNGFAPILPHFIEQTLNVNQLKTSFYQRYLQPQIGRIVNPLQERTALEKAYFSRMLTFVMKEQIMSKVGAQEGIGSSDAYLWNMPLTEKKETGNIYTDLRIIRKEASAGEGTGYDTLTLQVPPQGDGFLPNFRRGDMVYLYAYPADEEPDVRKHILYKGTLTDIRTAQLVIHLSDSQQNPTILDPTPAPSRTEFAPPLPLLSLASRTATVGSPKGGSPSVVTRLNEEKEEASSPSLREGRGGSYALEHSGTGSASSLIGSLHRLMTASQSKRDLLLGLRAPQTDDEAVLSKTYHPDYDEIVLQAKRAQDYYLLVGPPGTGKTSMALRFLVEEHLTADGALLLMAYTNRAVDEICSMLMDAGIDFIRVANQYSTDKRFHPYLMEAVVEASPKRSAIQRRLLEARVMVGTTSMLLSRSYLFQFKPFSLAIVDEASQILEPHLMGLLCEVNKFILIGDHKQLPAVVQQDAEESAVHDECLLDIELDNCRNSLFERLIRIERKANRQSFVGILRKQGRMHPDVAAFPSREFYQAEQLEPVPLAHQLDTELPYHLPSTDAIDDFLKSRRVLFFPSRVTSRATSDKVNADEACIVVDLLRRIYRFYGDRFDATKTVGVIVPYRNQIAMIRQHLESLQLPELEEISIDTIERYQGSQRDIIIYSFTICNRYQLDFLTNNSFEENGQVIDRKLNVALTRARLQMIMTGHIPTLKENAIFRKMIAEIEDKGGVWT